MRVVLLPFHTTPPAIQLDGSSRDIADQQLDDAISKAHMAAGLMIKMGNDLLLSSQKQESIIERVRKLMPEVSIRVQRSYSWILLATSLLPRFAHYKASYEV